jgi:hypothetical protein
VAAQRRTVHIEVVEVVVVQQQQEQTHQVRPARLAVMALHQAFLEHSRHMLAVVAPAPIPAPILLVEQVGPAAAGMVDIQTLALLAHQTPVVVVVVGNLMEQATQVVQVS